LGHKYRRAIELQKKWASMFQRVPLQGPIKLVGGGDVAFSRDGKWCVGAIMTLTFPGLEEQERAFAWERVTFPYIPGLLSFREAPVLIKAARKLSKQPDVLIVDGQGLAHPRRFGLACHVGVRLNWPTIGCAKSRLIGTHRPVGVSKGCRCKLIDQQEVIGSVVRSRAEVKCIYVSEGHRVELEQAVKFVLRCCGRYRLPEPIRSAHNMVTKLRLNRTAETIDR